MRNYQQLAKAGASHHASNAKRNVNAMALVAHLLCSFLAVGTTRCVHAFKRLKQDRSWNRNSGVSSAVITSRNDESHCQVSIVAFKTPLIAAQDWATSSSA